MGLNWAKDRQRELIRAVTNPKWRAKKSRRNLSISNKLLKQIKVFRDKGIEVNKVGESWYAMEPGGVKECRWCMGLIYWARSLKHGGLVPINEGLKTLHFGCRKKEDELEQDYKRHLSGA